MSEQKRITPYQRLLDAAREFNSKVQYRHRKLMWRYPKDRLNEGWRLGKLAERVTAAEQLGYDVMVTIASDGSLQIMYVKKIPDAPWEFKL